MPAELRKIPGATQRRRRHWRPGDRDLFGAPPPRPRPPAGAWSPLPAFRARRRWVIVRKREIQWGTVAVALGWAVLGLYLLNVFWSATRVDVAVDGIVHESQLTSATLADRIVRLTIDPGAKAGRATLRLDGRDVPDDDFEIQGDTIIWRPGQVAEGDHQLSLSVPRPILANAQLGWRFTVDDTPPRIDVPPLAPAVGVCDPVTLRGRVEPGAAATLDNQPLDVDDEGEFTLRYHRPPNAPLHLRAADAAGNVSEREVIVPVRYPGAQGMHVTAAAWGYEPLRREILAMVDAGLVSAVELDLKDEDGVVGFDSRVPLARQIGAVRSEYKILDAVDELKRRRVRVIGRIVAYRDAILADWAWANGRRDWVVQSAEGGKLDAYEGFTNAANADVNRYNLDIALEAVGAGVDDILWDYVRRPEGDLQTMVFPGLRGTPSDAVVNFLASSRAALRERCAYQGASVFGIAADRPDAVGQDVPRIARTVDYVAPMLYPSHWVPGEYDVENPNAQPGDIVQAALADFQAKMHGTGTALVPWLQDFSLGVPYGPAEVRAQINAAAQLGVANWLLWNGGATYTAGALDPSLVRRPG